MFIVVVLLALGWMLCCCYLGKHFFLNSQRAADGYDKIRSVSDEPPTMPDRLATLFEMTRV